ncbi:MAG: RNA methyltransferase [Chlamydiia bacterium]|nr:RNA methyltransferase [Chlamydiia bacterium]
MVALSIKSLQHPIIKELVEMRKLSSEHDHVLVMGKKIVLELAQTHPIQTLILQDHLDIAEFPEAEHTYQVSEAIIKKITGLPAPEGICAVIKKPKFVDLSQKTRILALDHVSDPGNLGNLLRTALALGYEGAYLIGGVNPFNDKALRAAKGATFYLPLQVGEPIDFLTFLEKSSITGITGSLRGAPLASFRATTPFAVILGNEGCGLTPEIANRCQGVTIPMSGQSESLNVAVAGGIILYALVQ